VWDSGEKKVWFHPDVVDVVKRHLAELFTHILPLFLGERIHVGNEPQGEIPPLCVVEELRVAICGESVNLVVIILMIGEHAVKYQRIGLSGTDTATNRQHDKAK
jgi:hypothetical protein